MNHPFRIAATTCLALCSLGLAAADSSTINVDVAHPGIAISPTLYGVMTEEINHSYDGGLYGELIQNRAFNDNATTPVHWALVQDGGAAGTMALDTSDPLTTALPTSLKLTVTTANAGQRVGIANDGYWGIPVTPKTQYTASFYAKAAPGFTGPITVDIESADGTTTFAKASVASITGNWAKYTVTLTTARVATTDATRFIVSTSSPGTLWLTQVSLFPPTFNNRPNGNRADLMQKMIAMHPAFIRLPGGNYLEGNEVATRFEWKNTIGDVTQRAGHQGPWGYRSSDGLGLLEFLEWCEDIHAKPLLAVYAGYSLRGEHVDAGPDLAPYVQDALDEIEYVTGDASTKWGAVRAANGHPAPFPLTYVEVGNEDAFDHSHTYPARFSQFYDAIRAKYPALKIIATCLPFASNWRTSSSHPADMTLNGRQPDVVDDHYYRSAAAMEADSTHYDLYDRKGPKIFVGEWAGTEGNPTPTLNAALGDSAWMIGMERNSDIVELSSYAPLLVNVNPGAKQWGTNLIGFDALQSFGSPSYYAQVLFAANKGDKELPIAVKTPAPTTVAIVPMPSGAIGVGTWKTQAQFKDITVTSGNQTLYQSDFTVPNPAYQTVGGTWSVQDGALAQTGNQTGATVTIGDPKWSNYTLTLKAQKTGGDEGFLIKFHVKDQDNFLWWNVGGWKNTATAIERYIDGSSTKISDSVPQTVTTGQWYDVRIEVQDRHIKCYLDDKLVSEADDTPPPPVDHLYAGSSRDLATGDVIVKLVNTSADPLGYTMTLSGVKHVAKIATLTMLTGSPRDVNSIAEPIKIVPVAHTILAGANSFPVEIPPYSVNVLRVSVK